MKQEQIATLGNPYQHFGEKEWFSPTGPGSFLLRRNSCSFSFTSVLAMAPSRRQRQAVRTRPCLHAKCSAAGQLTLFALLLVPEQQQLLLQPLFLLLFMSLLLQLPLLLQLLLPLCCQQLLLLLSHTHTHTCSGSGY